jgi:ribonucleoside-diphosphate reductase alpha chain
MWENRVHYNGLTVLPRDGGTHKQMPFEKIPPERFLELTAMARKIDLRKVTEEEDNTDLKGEVACAGGACEVTFA